MRSPRQCCRGFTLIELLTFIAIVGILAAITIPVIGMVRGKARAANSVSNLRQIFVALNLFADEHRDLFPKAAAAVDWTPGETNPAQLSWAKRLLPCALGETLFLTPCFEREGSAYFIGARAAFVATGGQAAVRRNRIQFPSRFVLAGEVNYKVGEPDFDKDDYT